LARAGSLSAAARQLGAEHTTVARRIGALEATLGVRLFDRGARGYALTAEGEQIAELAYRVENEVLGIERLAQSRQGGLSGVVRISAPPTFASHFLAPRLADLRAAYPGLQLELVGESRDVSLSRREADLAVRLIRPQPASMVARRLGAMAFGLYASREYLGRTPIADLDYLGYDDSLEHVPQQRWLRGLAGDRPLVLRANDLSTLHEAAAAGVGAAVLPRFLGDPNPRLGRIPVDGATGASRDIWLLVHPDLRRSPRVRAVMDYLADLISTARPILDPADSEGRADGSLRRASDVPGDEPG
jgi:DNA-binding transcriptional LysR family regulator